MSTGKRLAKRSILGTRVACWLEDGKYYPGVICGVKTTGYPASPYTVRIEGERLTRDLKESDLVGSGFTPVNSVKLRADQKVYITHNQREFIGSVIYHRPNIDEVLISVTNPENGLTQEVKKRLEEIRLLESRKSARLADQDTDFAKLADCASERMNRKTSSTIDVPMNNGSRKRRNSPPPEDLTDECSAALVLMKLSCSPRSPILPDISADGSSVGSTDSSGVWSLSSMMKSKADGRSVTPSPPLSESSPSHPQADDGIELEDLYEESGPRKRRSSTRIMFKCTWQGCSQVTTSCDAIEQHIRSAHLGRRILSSDCESDSDDDHEEEFYWTEIEISVATNVDPLESLSQAKMSPTHTTQVAPPAISPGLTGFTFKNNAKFVTSPASVSIAGMSPKSFGDRSVPFEPSKFSSYTFMSPTPTLSHRDMAKPAHEDPDYGVRQTNSPSILSSSWPRMSTYLAPGKMKARTSLTPKGSGRGKRGGESRKCRKVYGMEQKDQWCTQCKWKKACSRFSE